MSAHATVQATFGERRSAAAAMRDLVQAGFSTADAVLMKGMPARGRYTVAVLADDRFRLAEDVLKRHRPYQSTTTAVLRT